jgi:hypothetical protein
MKQLVRIAGALALLGGVSLGSPSPAAADFALSIGLPGFSFYAAPCHRPYYAPPVYYAPPAYYYPPPPPVVVYPSGYGFHHRPPGWYRGSGHWKTAHGYRFPGRR